MSVGLRFGSIILPPARRERPVRVVVIMAVVMSLMFRYLPKIGRAHV